MGAQHPHCAVSARIATHASRPPARRLQPLLVRLVPPRRAAWLTHREARYRQSSACLQSRACLASLSAVLGRSPRLADFSVLAGLYMEMQAERQVSMWAQIERAALHDQ